jgi:hypothetical protein
MERRPGRSWSSLKFSSGIGSVSQIFELRVGEQFIGRGETVHK